MSRQLRSALFNIEALLFACVCVSRPHGNLHRRLVLRVRPSADICHRYAEICMLKVGRLPFERKLTTNPKVRRTSRSMQGTFLIDSLQVLCCYTDRLPPLSQAQLLYLAT
ncbi:hypothetical protein C8J57DRAFT_413114 [Mycena rebaudengoi]|nr:hypothetical protein C8J57DRAFT_413114 [Mycena rebaudengoi]